MKRHPSLHALSGEHHLGLVQARALRRAAGGTVDRAAQAVRGFLAFWSDSLAGHFRAEEEVLLPHALAHLPADDPLIVRTLVEHQKIRQRVIAMGRHLDQEGDVRENAAWMGQFLNDHIRFEERVLFPAIERALPPEELEELATAFSQAAERDFDGG